MVTIEFAVPVPPFRSLETSDEITMESVNVRDFVEVMNQGSLLKLITKQRQCVLNVLNMLPTARQQGFLANLGEIACARVRSRAWFDRYRFHAHWPAAAPFARSGPSQAAADAPRALAWQKLLTMGSGRWINFQMSKPFEVAACTSATSAKSQSEEASNRARNNASGEIRNRGINRHTR